MASRSVAGRHDPRLADFRSDDVEEAVDYLGREYGAHSRVPLQRGPLGFRLLAAISRRAVAGWTTIGMGSSVHAAVQKPTVHLPLQQGVEYRVGRRSLRSDPDRAVLLAPGHDYSARVPAGVFLGVQVDPSLLEEELDARHKGRSRRLVIQSVSCELSTADVAELASLATAQRVLVESGRGKPDHAQLQASERRLAAWTAKRILEQSGLSTPSPASLQLAEDLESWIRRHAAEPISFERLRALSGVSTRCLQKACLARWGQTPLELVTARRLERVRARLLGRPRPESVTQVAIDCGFTHLGRFAGLYKRTYGESPSETLARQSQNGALETLSPSPAARTRRPPLSGRSPAR